VVEEVAVVDGDDVGGAGGGEVDDGSGVRDDCAVGVDEGGSDVGDVVPVGCDGGLGGFLDCRGAARGGGLGAATGGWCGLGGGSWWGCFGEWVEGGGEDEFCGFAGGAEDVLGDDLACGAGYGFEGAGGVGKCVDDGAGVGVELLGAEGFVVEEEFDLFGVGVDLDVFGVRGLVGWGPIGEEGLGEAGRGRGVGGLVAGVGGGFLGDFDAAGDADHGGC
jgi:hypothetical protein